MSRCGSTSIAWRLLSERVCAKPRLARCSNRVERLIIATGDGALELLDVQPAGKRAMSASEFLRGNRVRPGDRFGPA